VPEISGICLLLLMLILQGIPAYCEEELGFIPIWEEQGDQAATAEKNGEKPEPALPVTDTALKPPPSVPAPPVEMPPEKQPVIPSVKASPQARKKRPRRILASLTVRTDPPDARVRVLNIKPRYHDGIRLAPGSYRTIL